MKQTYQKPTMTEVPAYNWYVEIIKEMSAHSRHYPRLNKDILDLEVVILGEVRRRGGFVDVAAEEVVRCEVAGEIYRFLNEWKECDEYFKWRLHPSWILKPRLVLERPLTAIAWSVARILHVHRHLQGDSQAIFSLG